MAEAGGIVDQVQAKRYTRNDTGEHRHGFIAQDLEAACSDPFFAHIVGSTPATDDEGEEIGAPAIKTVDYSRLVAILWTTVWDLHSTALKIDCTQPGPPDPRCAVQETRSAREWARRDTRRLLTQQRPSVK